MLNAYIGLLRQSGFQQKYRGSDEVLVKRAGKEVWIFSAVEAMYDETTVSVGFSRDPKEA